MDIALTIISALCTVASFIGACKSIKYYKKSKQLTIYANTNIAFIETQKIISTLTEILKLSNASRRQRGLNLSKELGKHGESIKASINIMREKLPVEDFKEIQELLCTRQIQVERYIDSFITGTILDNEVLVIDDKFNLCQQTFYEIQQLIKKKIEKVEEKLV